MKIGVDIVAKKVFTKEMHDYIASIVDGRTNKQVQKMVEEKFNITFDNPDAIKNYINRSNIKRTVRGIFDNNRSIFSEEIKQFVFDNYKGIGNYELADMVNKEFGTSFTRDQLKNFKTRKKWNSGLDGRFQKGDIPFNKGKKMTKEIYDKCKGTMLKKGNIPKNHREVGEERINVDGYIEIKVAEPNKWKLKQRFVWEKYKGKLKSTDKIAFLDGNKLNTDINNLVILSNDELMEMNRKRLFTNDRGITETGTLIAKVNVKARNRKKEVRK